MEPSNPRKYSLAELFEALESIDAVRFPERKAELDAELQQRRKSGELAAYENKQREKQFASLHMSNTKVLLNAIGAGFLILVGISLLVLIGHHYLIEIPQGADRKNPLAALMWAVMALLYAIIVIKRIRFSLSLRPVNDD
jgi:hypothetical protein